MKIIAEYRVSKSGEGWWYAGIEGGPKDLLRRTTEKAAIAAGEAYADERWGRTAEGEWTPYSAARGKTLAHACEARGSHWFYMGAEACMTCGCSKGAAS